MDTHELVIAIISSLCGVVCGANIGIFVMALMVAAKRKMPIMTEENGEESLSRLDEVN
jgi:ABC-type microcin C transport system permease subunit YejE